MVLTPGAVSANSSTVDRFIWLPEWGDGHAPARLERVAAHESGHALVCVEEGLKFTSVSISGTDGDVSGIVKHRFKKSSVVTSIACIRIKFLAAGIVAEVESLGRASRSGSENDRMYITHLAKLIADNNGLPLHISQEENIVRRAADEVRTLLQRKKEDLERLQQALLEKVGVEISYEDAKGFLGY